MPIKAVPLPPVHACGRHRKIIPGSQTCGMIASEESDDGLRELNRGCLGFDDGE